ncbi:hypothetical protein PJI17_06565 [Mycobacterium kansasii]
MLTESAVIPPFRVCSDGFDCVCRAGTCAAARPDGTVGAVSARSAPSAAEPAPATAAALIAEDVRIPC